MSDYRIIREVGKGGMGCVYEALDSYGTKIALKMMSAKAASHPDYREMFDYEVQSLRKLSNPSIVKIVGEPFSDANGNLFLPMEFVEGKTLSQIIKSEGPFNENDAISIFTKLLDVFSYIHGKSCIHRDVKPSNIMIRPDGSVCVIDFGIAKDSKTSTGKTIGRVVGTDGYMSPEQANGYNIDTRTDIYSLGCLLHYMLTGTHAIAKQSNDYDTICAILENNFPLVSDKGITISDRTQKAILTAVNKNMTIRFQTTEEFKRALTDTQKSKSSTNTYAIISVGRSNVMDTGSSHKCDIIMQSEYVSGHHLDIIWEPQNESGTLHKVTINDHSTNGTGVNGRKIKNESYSFVVDKSVKYLLNDYSSLPQVMIAGLTTHILDWEKVLSILFEKMDLPTSVVEEGEEGEIPPQENTEDITVGFGILCFVIPIVGWILGAVWKSEFPIKSKSANKLALYGFIFNIITFQISKLLMNL